MVFKIFSRKISIVQPLRSTLQQPLSPAEILAAEKKYEEAGSMWKKVFYFACIPTLIMCAANVYLEEEEKRPEFKPYEHLRIRNKKYPWGDGNRSFFHNPHTNALPDGYES